jgi:hypothetical protein
MHDRPHFVALLPLAPWGEGGSLATLDQHLRIQRSVVTTPTMTPRSERTKSAILTRGTSCERDAFTCQRRSAVGTVRAAVSIDPGRRRRRPVRVSQMSHSKSRSSWSARRCPSFSATRSPNDRLEASAKTASDEAFTGTSGSEGARPAYQLHRARGQASGPGPDPSVRASAPRIRSVWEPSQ